MKGEKKMSNGCELCDGSHVNFAYLLALTETSSKF